MKRISTVITVIVTVVNPVDNFNSYRVERLEVSCTPAQENKVFLSLPSNLPTSEKGLNSSLTGTEPKVGDEKSSRG